MSLFSDAPLGRTSVSKKTIDQSHGPVVGGGPPALKKARIVKNRHTARLHKVAPVIPIALDGGLRVVSVDQEEVNWVIPRSGRVLAEFFYPNYFSAPMGLNGSSRRPLREIQSGSAAQMKWVDQV